MNDEMRITLRLALLGALVGIVVCNGISIALSSTPDSINIVARSLSDEMGEVPAVILQLFLTAATGAVMFSSTMVYHSERFGLTVASLIHMVIAIIVMDIVANILWWCDRTVSGTMFFSLYLFMIYLLIWFSIFASYWVQIRHINEALEKRRSKEE